MPVPMTDPQPQTVDMVLSGGLVVNENGTLAASIAVDDGRIVAIGEDRLMPPARERVSLDGLHVLPGAIDVHVHFREPGMPRKEDWGTGSAAASPPPEVRLSPLPEGEVDGEAGG